MYGVRGTFTPHLKPKKHTRFENIVIKTVIDQMCIYLRLTIAKNYKHIPQIHLVTPTFRPPNDDTPRISHSIIVVRGYNHVTKSRTLGNFLS